MEQAKLYVVIETIGEAAPYVYGGALTEDNAVILADGLADNVVNTGAIAKVTDIKHDTPATTEPREIRRYEFRRAADLPTYKIQVLEMLAATNPDY